MKTSLLIILFVLLPNYILTQDVAILYPTPTTKLYPKENIEIQWSNPNNRPVDLYYKLDDTNWQLLADNLSSDKFPWQVPQSTSENVLFKVEFSDIQTPELIWHQTQAHSEEIRSGMFSPSGNFLFTSSKDNFVRVWDIQNQEMLNEVDLSRIGLLNYCIPISDNKAFAAVDDYLVQINFSGGNIIPKVISIGSRVNSIDYTPSHGGIIASTSSNGKVYIFDTDLNYIKEYSTNGGDIVYSVRFSHDGNMICFGDYSGYLNCYDYGTNNLIFSRTGHGSQGQNSIIWSTDIKADNSKVATCGTDLTVRLWDNSNVDARKIFDSHTGHVRSIRTSPTDDLLISGSLDGLLKFYNTAEEYEFNLITTDHGTSILSVDISGDGNFAASSGRGNDFKIWRLFKMQRYEDVVESRIFREVSIYIPDMTVEMNENFVLPILSGYSEDDVIFQNHKFQLEITLEIPVLLIDVDLIPNVRSGIELDTVTTTVEFDVSKDTILKMNSFSLLGPSNIANIRILSINTESGLELKKKDGIVTIIPNCENESTRGLIVAGNPQNISANPNPANDYVKLEVDVIENGMYEIEISDMTGRKVISYTKRLDYGHHQIQLDVTSLSNGSYSLRLKGTQVINSIPLIINK